MKRAKATKQPTNIVTEPAATKPLRPRAKTKDNHYVDAEQLRADLIDFYAKDPDSKPSDPLSIQLMKIAQRLSFSSKFKGYTFREAMVSDAIERMLMAVLRRKYDPTKGNPFAYFTRIAYNSFKAAIKGHSQYTKMIDSYKEVTYDSMCDSDESWRQCRRARANSDEEMFNDE